MNKTSDPNAFQYQVAQLGGSQRACLQHTPGIWHLPEDSCWFGVPEDEQFGWTYTQTIPAHIRRFHFFYTEHITELFRLFVHSAFPVQTESLTIGDSSFSDVTHGCNYQSMIQLMTKTTWSHLTQLDLGNTTLFHNGANAVGRLGNLTPILAMTPKLTGLWLGGHFELNQPLCLPELSDLNIEVISNLGLGPAPLSTNTVTQLLSSPFPNLKTAYIDLDSEQSSPVYHLPDALIQGTMLPQIEYLELVGCFAAGSRAALLAGPLATRAGLRLELDDMEEVDVDSSFG